MIAFPERNVFMKGLYLNLNFNFLQVFPNSSITLAKSCINCKYTQLITHPGIGLVRAKNFFKSPWPYKREVFRIWENDRHPKFVISQCRVIG